VPINFNIKILYVEDEYITRQEVRNILKTKYKNVLVAKNGAVGFALFEKENPDLIITDLKMPECDGIEMVRKIRAKDSKIPIIVASAFEKEFFKFDDLNIQDYIIKPITKFCLLITIEDVMSNYEGPEL
jgi:YesN/AraC family two-component response regulator